RDWTKAEERTVARALRTGRKSVAEIARRLEGSKSLRQVAEHLERRELWSRVLGAPARGGPEAEEVMAWAVAAEDAAAAADGQEEDRAAASDNEQFEEHMGRATAIGERYRCGWALINAEFATVLTRIVAHDDAAWTTHKASAFAGEALEALVRRVVRELAATATPARAAARRDVDAALERCGLPPARPAQATLAAVLRRHVADGAAVANGAGAASDADQA
ncbi:hypothetical protein H4R18_001612, partial [Coemansia javaensis]